MIARYDLPGASGQRAAREEFAMYTTLDRIDIVTKSKDTGRQGYVLTDHRSAAEIEAEPELSILYALTRVGAALAMGAREGGADVTYVCASLPPAFLQEAVASAGGRLTVEAKPMSVAPPSRPLGDIADSAFGSLAGRLRDRLQGALDEALLTRLEDETLQSPPDKDEDEGAYWTRVLELAAVCGELLRAKTGGRWSEAADHDGIFPFAFCAGNATINVADKAHRFLDQGESQRPSQLLLMADDLDHGADGPLMVNLKPGDFPRDRGVCRELLEGMDSDGPGSPLVFVGHDQPNTFAFLPASSDRSEIDRSFGEALANLARLELAAEEHDVAGVKVLVVGGHYYASEKILDEGFLKTLHRRLGAELLVAATPHKGLLLVSDAAQPIASLAVSKLAEARFSDSEGAPPLSPVAFLVREGKVVGHVASRREDSPPPKGGLWRRLFRSH